MMEAPRFSVVVNTLNRAEQLADALLAISHLDYPEFEVVVVNGPSTDETDKVLQGWAGKIKLGKCPVANLSLSRNIGIAMAAGDIVAFVDDDAAPHPMWLAMLAEAFRDPRVGGAGGYTIDNTGVRFQAVKTLCDRRGDARSVPTAFDEAVLCKPGAALYPSLLGTNSAFRKAALTEIGGFDEVIAYFLDETDVCLRLVDRGWSIRYVPDALVWHQFAPSALRDADTLPRSIYPIAVSKAYFIARHSSDPSRESIDRPTQAYVEETAGYFSRLQALGRISPDRRWILDGELRRGTVDGLKAARQRSGTQAGDLKIGRAPEPFKRMGAQAGRSVALVATTMADEMNAFAAMLVHRGHRVHVLAPSADLQRCEFRAGVWRHHLAAPFTEEVFALADGQELPLARAAWMKAYTDRLKSIESFGIDLVVNTQHNEVGRYEWPTLVVDPARPENWMKQVELRLSDGSHAV